MLLFPGTCPRLFPRVLVASDFASSSHPPVLSDGIHVPSADSRAPNSSSPSLRHLFFQLSHSVSSLLIPRRLSLKISTPQSDPPEVRSVSFVPELPPTLVFLSALWNSIPLSSVFPRGASLLQAPSPLSPFPTSKPLSSQSAVHNALLLLESIPPFDIDTIIEFSPTSPVRAS